MGTALRLLWGHVGQASHDVPVSNNRLLSAHQSSQAEIGQLRFDFSIFLPWQQDVGRLHITMDHTRSMGIIKSQSDLVYEFRCLPIGQRFFLEALFQILAYDQLHIEEALPTLLTRFMQGNNAGVPQPGHHASIVLEQGGCSWPLRTIRSENLQG